MKKLILLLLFIPLVSFGQCECIDGYDCNTNPCTSGSTSVTVETKVNNVTKVARPLVLSDEKTEVKVPITVDLYNYTHLVLVSVSTIRTGGVANNQFGAFGIKGKKNKPKYAYDLYYESLLNSPLTIVNPFIVDKKRAKKNPRFLKDVKKPSYLYFYFRRQMGSGNDDITTSVIVRDHKNKVVYSVMHTNTGIPEILDPLIGF